jgi:hypothetical protein
VDDRPGRVFKLDNITTLRDLLSQGGHIGTYGPGGESAAHRLLKAAGCGRLWLNGSFVTAKEGPADFDACWDPDGVDLDALDPIFLDFRNGRAAQKRRFGGELLANVTEAGSGLSFSEFFRNERDTGRKGIVVLTIGGQS